MALFFVFSPEIRKAIYTTDAIESLNITLRKVIKNHRAFPTDESALKVDFLSSEIERFVLERSLLRRWLCICRISERYAQRKVGFLV
ncbi:MAG: hypothetical protein F6K28_36840 [Microcoleus sp. SIO2G3]|nr:hypothetical protein [Microcoleus sp. SIO2G3]